MKRDELRELTVKAKLTWCSTPPEGTEEKAHFPSIIDAFNQANAFLVGYVSQGDQTTTTYNSGSVVCGKQTRDVVQKLSKFTPGIEIIDDIMCIGFIENRRIFVDGSLREDEFAVVASNAKVEGRITSIIDPKGHTRLAATAL
jgi:hypothetical protein